MLKSLDNQCSSYTTTKNLVGEFKREEDQMSKKSTNLSPSKKIFFEELKSDFCLPISTVKVVWLRNYKSPNKLTA